MCCVDGVAVVVVLKLLFTLVGLLQQLSWMLGAVLGKRVFVRVSLAFA